MDSNCPTMSCGVSQIGRKGDIEAIQGLGVRVYDFPKFRVPPFLGSQDSGLSGL